MPREMIVAHLKEQSGKHFEPHVVEAFLDLEQTDQRIEKDAKGRTVLKGELLNESGQTVNIPHVLATFNDDSGKVIWVSDGYVAQALLPQTPVPFAVDLPPDVAKNVQTYRVIVNHFELTS